MAGFHGDLARLTEHAAEFDDHATHARRIASTLRHAIESAGDCWGDDEIGQRFAAGHLAPAEAALAAVEELPDRLHELGGKFAATAETTRRSDQTGVAELSRSTEEG